MRPTLAKSQPERIYHPMQQGTPRLFMMNMIRSSAVFRHLFGRDGGASPGIIFFSM